MGRFDETLRDLEQVAKKHSSCLVAYSGGKESVHHWRRKTWGQFQKEYLVYPLREWSTRDVFAYLSMRHLPVPTGNQGDGAGASGAGVPGSGVDLTARDLLRIYDAYPDDFERIEAVFPYVKAVVKRREWYNVAA